MRHSGSFEDPGLNPGRIAAITVAITAHLAAAVLLWAPVHPSSVDETGERVVDLVFIEPPPPPPPPPPPEPQPVIKSPEPKPVVQSPPPPRPTPRLSPSPSPIVVSDPGPMDVPADPPSPPAPVTSIEPQAESSGPAGNGTARDGVVVVLVSPDPPYPREALRAGIQGTVILRIEVDPSGNPSSVSIERSSGNRDLDRAAQRHVQRTWRFQGTGQVQIARLPIDFRLN